MTGNGSRNITSAQMFLIFDRICLHLIIFKMVHFEWLYIRVWHPIFQVVGFREEPDTKQRAYGSTPIRPIFLHHFA
jgi:hypothetical protein